MNIRFEELPEGAELVRIWLDGHTADVDPIDTVCVIVHETPDKAVVEAAHGTLGRGALQALAHALYERGVRVVRFSALRGKRVSRYAKMVSYDQHFCYYEANLADVIKQMEESA